MGQQWDKSNYAALIDSGEWLYLSFNTAHITALADEAGNGEPEYFNIGLHRDIAKVVFEKYYP
ncbi:MAG: hypothetical protein LBC85_01870 [Fibromonadaceae bacterium]|jgi:hypothetical protein|nr:hypothetical protein [Fibromonadaceae bacterium]